MQFLRTGADRWQTAQREREAERTAYDTQLFGQQPEEEPIENLTGSLPEPPRPARHPAFDVAPYLEEQEKAAAHPVHRRSRPPRRRPRLCPPRTVRTLTLTSVPTLRPARWKTPCTTTRSSASRSAPAARSALTRWPS